MLRRLLFVFHIMSGAAFVACASEESSGSDQDLTISYDAEWRAFWLGSSWRASLPSAPACKTALARCERWAYQDEALAIACTGRTPGDVYCDSMVKGCLAGRDLTGVTGHDPSGVDTQACNVARFFQQTPRREESPTSCQQSGGRWKARPGYRHPSTSATSPSDACTSAPDGIFRECCLKHDRDWLTCEGGGHSQRRANEAFLACMVGVCDRTIPALSSPHTACVTSARGYAAAVGLSSSYYNDTQRIACYCD